MNNPAFWTKVNNHYLHIAIGTIVGALILGFCVEGLLSLGGL